MDEQRLNEENQSTNSDIKYTTDFIKCPQCGSTNIDRKNISSRYSAFLALLIICFIICVLTFLAPVIIAGVIFLALGVLFSILFGLLRRNVAECTCKDCGCSGF